MGRIGVLLECPVQGGRSADGKSGGFFGNGGLVDGGR